MSDNELDDGYSLADLADIDISEIEEVRFVSIPAGVYEFEVGDADLEEDEKDGIRRFKISFPNKIVEVKSCLDTKVEKESLVGLEIVERFFIDPSKSEQDVAKAFGRVKAFIKDIGCDASGKLGDAVRNTKGTVFRSQVTLQADKNDKTKKYPRLKLEPKR